MEPLKPITRGKPRRAPKGADAARFFDESVRNSYARRATTPQTASWRQGEFRAGCLPPTYALPRVYFGKARTPKEARRAAPRLGFYRQDNDVHGGVPCVPPLCIVFLDFRSRSCFAPVVCLQHTRYRVYVSAKRERQRKVGQPVRPYVFIFKTTSVANALRLLCDVFLDFRSRSARGRSATFKRSFGRQSAPSLP